MDRRDVKLTKLAKCAGCGAKVGAGVLAQLLEGIQVHQDPNLLVGFDKSDDASVYKVSDELALVQTRGLLPAHCRRSLYLRPDRGHQRPVGCVRHGRRAQAGSEHHVRAGGHAQGHGASDPPGRL